MQIMPFNVGPFAKSLGMDNVDLNDMFNPNIALKFGNYYLNHLKKEFNHPLFVAYAYNAEYWVFKEVVRKLQTI